MSDFQILIEAVLTGDIRSAVAETKSALESGRKVQEILDKGLIPAMDEVGYRYSKAQIFIPEMFRAARTMQECMEHIRPLFEKSEIISRGTVVIGTVKQDIHDIGKNLVSMMMEGGGFTIVDLGVEVSPRKFVHKAKEVGADIVAMSALLTTTMPAMLETIEALEQAGIRQTVKVMVGGAPVTEQYARKIRADLYAPDAGSAVLEAKKLLVTKDSKAIN